MTARKIHASEHDLPRSFLSPSSYQSTTINFLVSFHHFIPSVVAWDVIYQSLWGGVSFRPRSGGSNQKLSVMDSQPDCP